MSKKRPARSRNDLASQGPTAGPARQAKLNEQKVPRPPTRSMPAGSFVGARNLLPIGLILVATFLVFEPALQNGFVDWDDGVNVYENQNLKAPLTWEGIARIFGREGTVMGGYNPLPILTFALEKELFGLDLQDARNVRATRVLHTTNLLLHLLCVFLAYRILLMLGLQGFGAAFAALLFGIHPMRVESVAWITERKDVLFGAFYLGALATYLKFLQTPRRKGLYYGLTLGLCVLSLFAKIQAVSLPLSMLALDYYFRRPFKIRVLAEKAPFFLLSLLFGLWGLYVGAHAGLLKDVPNYGVASRVAIAAYAYCVYLLKLIVPYEMSPLYPYPPVLRWYLYAAIPLVLAVLASVVWRWKRGDRAVVFAAAFYTFNVVFVLQLLPAGRAFLADRFTYIPYLGCFFLLGVAIDGIASKRPGQRPFFLVGAAAYCLLLMVATRRQIPIWRNGETLWTHVVKQHANDPVSFISRAYYYRTFAGQYAKAMADYDRAVALDPRRKETFNERGKLFFDLQRTDEAIADYTKAIELDSTVAEYFANRGAAFASKGQMDPALRDLDRCLELDPHHLHGLLNRALVLQEKGSPDAAVVDYNTYLEVRPGQGNIWYERGLCYRTLGREQEAVSDFTEAIRLDPAGKFTPLYYVERARSHFLLGHQDAARGDARKAKLRGAALPPELDQLVP